MSEKPNYIQPVIDALADTLVDCPADLIDLYALLAFTRGRDATLEDVHDAWSIWRNRTNPDHRSLIPFPLLTPDVQELDRKYLDAIRACSTRQGSATACSQETRHG